MKERVARIQVTFTLDDINGAFTKWTERETSELKSEDPNLKKIRILHLFQINK